jgi:hypothetical protein
MYSWTKNNAIQYCIKVAKLTVHKETNNVKQIIELYQHILFSNNEEKYYKKLWNSVIKNYIPILADTLYKEPEKAIEYLELEFERQRDPKNLDEYITCVSVIQKIISNTHQANIDILRMCMPSMQEFIINQLEYLYKKDISGPECLIRYVYPYVGDLILPKGNTNLWLIPSLKPFTYGIRSISPDNSVPKMCSFCQQLKSQEAFAIQYTQYTYFILTACEDCVDFKRLYRYYYLNEHDIIELSITEENKIDLSSFEKK